MKEILGQERAVGVLQAELGGGRLHHAYIFYGPWGVGKFTCAAAFARVLLCHERKAGSGGVASCGRCSSCVLMAGDITKSEDGEELGVSGWAHPDLHVVNKELARFSDDRLVRERKLMTIPVDVLREALLERVFKTAQMKHGKVFIVDEAELVSVVGQNMLLKTLEEPPGETRIILVTSHEDRLLATIRSRCQRVGFGGLPVGVLADWLKGNGGKLTEVERDWLLGFADGSLGRLKLAVDYGLQEWGAAVTPGLEGMVRGAFPVELGKTMAKLIDDFASRWVKGHGNASKEAANKQGAGLMFALIGQHARGRVMREAKERAGLGVAEAGERIESWARVIDRVRVAEEEIGGNLNMGLVCDHLAAMIYEGMACGVRGREEVVSGW